MIKTAKLLLIRQLVSQETLAFMITKTLLIHSYSSKKDLLGQLAT